MLGVRKKMQLTQKWVGVLKEAAQREPEPISGLDAFDRDLKPQTMAFALQIARVVDEKGYDVDELKGLLGG